MSNMQNSIISLLANLLSFSLPDGQLQVDIQPPSPAWPPGSWRTCDGCTAPPKDTIFITETVYLIDTDSGAKGSWLTWGGWKPTSLTSVFFVRTSVSIVPLSSKKRTSIRKIQMSGRLWFPSPSSPVQAGRRWSICPSETSSSGRRASQSWTPGFSVIKTFFRVGLMGENREHDN